MNPYSFQFSICTGDLLRPVARLGKGAAAEAGEAVNDALVTKGVRVYRRTRVTWLS